MCLFVKMHLCCFRRTPTTYQCFNWIVNRMLSCISSCLNRGGFKQLAFVLTLSNLQRYVLDQPCYLDRYMYPNWTLIPPVDFVYLACHDNPFTTIRDSNRHCNKSKSQIRHHLTRWCLIRNFMFLQHKWLQLLRFQKRQSKFEYFCYLIG